jgi:methionine sulfoxide reductase heme-binding subunit
LRVGADGVLMLDGHLFWLISRAAGTAALMTSSVSVGLGLLMAARVVKRRTQDMRAIHEALAIATIIAIVVHAVTLLGDSFLSPGIADITIPFVSGYREPWMSIGIVAGWALVVLSLSFYWRGRIGPARWRRMHRFTALAWVAAVAHSFGTGTDATTTWFLLINAVLVVPAAVLLAARHLGGGTPTPKPKAVLQ